MPVPTIGQDPWGEDLNATLLEEHNSIGRHTTLFDVRAYGATGDGNTNDTTNFGLAVAAAAPTNGVVFLSPGTYLVSPTVFSSPVRFVGANRNTSIIKLLGQGGGANVALLTISGNNSIFEEIGFDGNKATIGSGFLWSGAIVISAGISGATFRRCRFTNTARSAIYGLGTSGNPIRNVVVENCEFTNIGVAGAGTGGACVFLEQNIIDCKIRNNVASGQLTSNFVKLKGDIVASPDNVVSDNTIDYSAVTGLDGTNDALAIEFWNGTNYGKIIGNTIIGLPDSFTPSAANGFLFGVSLSHAWHTIVQGNTVRKAGTSNQKIQYGIEVAGSPYCTVSDNEISGCVYGTNLTFVDPPASRHCTLQGNIYRDCYENSIHAISADHLAILGGSIVDGGIRYVMIENSSDIRIEDVDFGVENQDRVDGEGSLFGVYYIVGAGVDIRGRVENCTFAPIAGGIGTKGLRAVHTNHGDRITVKGCYMNGAAPTGGVNNAWAIAFTGTSSGHLVEDNEAINFASGFATGQADYAKNRIGSLAISYGAGSTNTTIDALGNLNHRNHAGTTTGMGGGAAPTAETLLIGIESPTARTYPGAFIPGTKAVTGVRVRVTGGTSVTLNLYNAGRNLYASNQVVTASPGYRTLSLPGTTYLPATSALDVVVTAVSGVVTDLVVEVSIDATTDQGSAYFTEVRADNPVGYWRLGEPSGTVADDSSTTNNDGTYTPAFVGSTAGALLSDTNPAIDLNGTTEYISIANHASYAGGSGITLEAWVKFTSTSDMSVVDRRNASNVGGYFLASNAGYLQFWVNLAGGWQYAEVTSPYNDGNWHHVVGTYNGSTLTLYVDTVAAPVNNTAGTVNNPTSPSLYIGNAASSSRFFAGQIDEVAIYGAPLSLARIQAHYAASGR